MRTWTAEQVALLGTDTDRAIGKRLELSAQIVTQGRRRHGIPAFRQDSLPKGAWKIVRNAERLGKAPDSVLADELGISIKSVQSARRARGIPAFVERAGWDGYEHLLGRMPDLQIAELRGVTRATVACARKVRGIPAYRSTKPTWRRKRNNHSQDSA